MEYALILIGGLLGSSHCVGMCGGFALSVGATSQRVRQNVARQLVYSAGRVFTYAFLGTVAGFCGARLSDYAGTLVNVSATLSIFAGGLLLLQGLSILGWVPWKTTTGNTTPCLMGGFLRTFLLSSRWSDVFIAGVLTGFLPCGLVYAFLALASASGHMVSGALIMSAFGVGTVPLMVATGVSATAISRHARENLFRVAAVLVMLTGILTISRGITFAATDRSGSPIPCPFCHASYDADHQ